MQTPCFATQAKDGGWWLDVRVQPGARKTEISGLLDGRLKIRLAAPAVDNKANKALLAFIATVLHLRASKISLVSGDASRQKRLHVACSETPDWSLFGPLTQDVE